MVDPARRDELTAHLGTYLTGRRRERIEAVLAQRTRYLTLVLEDLYQPHNASAVLRSCECFGVQDVHVVEGCNAYRVNEQVAQGAGRWLDLYRYRAAEGQDLHTCARHLRDRGYRLVAATPGLDSVPVAQLPVDRPLAVILGTEEEGLSPAALGLAEARVRVPMYGFTESFNVSVSAALILGELSRRVRVADVPWQLGDEEKAELRHCWYCRSVRGSALIIERYQAAGAAARGALPLPENTDQGETAP